MANHQPDEVINSIRVLLHTADRSGAGTDSSVFVELFDPPPGWPAGFPFRVEIDTANHDDFEAGETWPYDLPAWYFAGRIVNDIVRVCVHKGDGWGSDWCFGWISIAINGQELFTSPNMATSPDQGIWLTDGTMYCESAFVRVLFKQPVLVQDGLPDASGNENYSVTLDAIGGHKPIRWFVSGSGAAFPSSPTLTVVANSNGTSALFAGHTASAVGESDWSGVIILMDVNDRTSVTPVSMRAIHNLPPPTIKSFTPLFGWPGLAPAAPEPVTVTIESNAQDFDSRSAGFTKIFFSKAGGGTVEAKVLQKTSSKVQALVPNGAVTGAITVQTPFGKSSSAVQFLVHANGYRFLSGFSFVNKNEDDLPGSGFPTTFAWQRFEETFGMDEMWLVVFDQAIVPNPIATMFYSLAHFTAGQGCCHGFCLTSLQLAHGILPSTAFNKDFNGYPLADSLWNFTGPSGAPDGLSHYVQDRQLVIYSDEGMSYFLDRIDSIGVVGGDPCEMDARDALNDLRQSINGGLSDPRMLAMARRCWPWEGHVTVPYQIEDQGAKSFLHLYNPNQPAQPNNPESADTQLSIRVQDGDWGFQWGPNELWRGLYMFTIPLSQYGHQNDWSIPGLSTLLATVGTFILGCAGTDANGDITQVRDDAGNAMFNPRGGTLISDRTKWPKGVRPAPQFGVSDTLHHIFGVTNTAAVTFTVLPKKGPSPVAPACLHIVAGSDLAFSLEDIGVEHDARFDAVTSALRVAPVHGTSAPILRITQRHRGTSESIAYAVRANGTAAGSPLEFGLSADRKGCVIRAAAVDRKIDIEVTHTNRVGQVRVFESDGIALPAQSVTMLQITKPEDLEVAGLLPLLLDIDPDGSGHSTNRVAVGSKLDGLTVVAPARVIAPAASAVGRPRASVSVDVSKSTTAFPASPMTFRVIDGPVASFAKGALTLSAPKGNLPVRIVAEDAAGHRSFPRSVFISAPELGQHAVPLYTVSSQDTQVAPGGTVSIPFSAFVGDLAATGFNLSFTPRQRLSGLGEGVPELVATGLVLSPALQAAGASQKVTVVAGGLGINIQLEWDAAKPLNGAFDLGLLQVHTPPTIVLGSMFVLRAGGTVATGSAASPTLQPVNVLPVLLKVWGGAEPPAFAIAGPDLVFENSSIVMNISGAGVAPNGPNVGWWAERISGQVGIQQDGADRNSATIRGVRAGYVRVKAVVGTTTAEKIVKVQASVRPRIIGRGRPILKLQPLPKQP